MSVTALESNVIQAYEKQTILCYQFEEVMYNSLSTASIGSTGDIMSYKEGMNTFYRGVQTYTLKGMHLKYEPVKSTMYFGTNFYRENFFKDFKAVREKDKRFAFSYEKYILSPGAPFFKRTFTDTNYTATVTESSDSYRLSLTDTNRYERGPDDYITKREEVYYISKKDFRIMRSVRSNFWTDNDLNASDSIITRYTYYQNSIKSIKTYINDFKPLAPMPEPARPPADTATIFPEFHLKDSTGTFWKPSTPYILVDFWYKACGPCLANMRFLDKLNYKGVQVVTINIRDSIDRDVRKIMSKHNYTFLFRGQDLVKQLRVQAFPTMYLIDERRNILYKHVGFGDTDELTELLNTLSGQ